MQYRTLGQTGLQVSEVGLGAMPFGGMVTQADGTQFGWSGTDDQELIALVHRSEELGTNLLDTAEAYGNGHGEAVVGEAVQGRRHKWIIATKVQPNRGLDAETPDEAAVRKRITEACEGSLRRLRTDYIDIYQLHAIPYSWAMPMVMAISRPTCRPRLIGGVGLLRPHVSRAASTRSTVAALAAPPSTSTSRSCSTRTCSPRGTTTSRSVAPR